MHVPDPHAAPGCACVDEWLAFQHTAHHASTHSTVPAFASHHQRSFRTFRRLAFPSTPPPPYLAKHAHVRDSAPAPASEQAPSASWAKRSRSPHRAPHQQTQWTPPPPHPRHGRGATASSNDAFGSIPARGLISRLYGPGRASIGTAMRQHTAQRRHRPRHSRLLRLLCGLLRLHVLPRRRIGPLGIGLHLLVRPRDVLLGVITQRMPDRAVALEARAKADLPDAVAALHAAHRLDVGQNVPERYRPAHTRTHSPSHAHARGARTTDHSPPPLMHAFAPRDSRTQAHMHHRPKLVCLEAHRRARSQRHGPQPPPRRHAAKQHIHQ